MITEEELQNIQERVSSTDNDLVGNTYHKISVRSYREALEDRKRLLAELKSVIKQRNILVDILGDSDPPCIYLDDFNCGHGPNFNYDDGTECSPPPEGCWAYFARHQAERGEG
ncbi:MAG: hypothetical protein LBE22_12355 [Azoarcus sp.]|jgi:hypothetical protein|nr:hypothetical protein [Azoarcus sp.]